MRSPTSVDHLAIRERFERAACDRQLAFDVTPLGPEWGLRYDLLIDVPEYNELRRANVFWSPLRPASPITHLPGPACRRHRNHDALRSVCLWHPDAPEEERWTVDDGLFGLHQLTTIHAWCEGRCRRGHPWPKSEAPRPHPRPPDCRQCPRQ